MIERNRALAAHLGRRAARAARSLAHVAEVRQTGMIVAVELVRERRPRRPFDWRERRGLRVYRHGLEHEALAAPDRQRRLLHAAVRRSTPEEIDALVATARDGIVPATCD